MEDGKRNYAAAAVLGLLFLLPMLMLGDAQCGMEQILCPAAIGRKQLISAKLLNAVLLSVFLTAVRLGTGAEAVSTLRASEPSVAMNLPCLLKYSI